MKNKEVDYIQDLLKWTSKNTTVEISGVLKRKDRDNTSFQMLTIAVKERLRNSPKVTHTYLGGNYFDPMYEYLKTRGWETNSINTWVHRTDKEVVMEFKFTKTVEEVN